LLVGQVFILETLIPIVMYSSNFYKILSVVSSVVLVAFVTVPRIEVAYADALTSVSDSLDTVTTAENPIHTIQFVTPTGVADTKTITITFPAAFTDIADVAFGDITITHGAGGLFTGGTAIVLAADCSNTALWSAVTSGQVVTLTACSAATANVAAAGGVRIVIDNNDGITNPAAASYSIDIAGTFGDTGSAIVTIVADSSVAVTAEVPAGGTLTFAISATAIEFGNLSVLAPKYADASAGSFVSTIAHTLTVSSSAAYAVTVSGTTLTKGGDNIDAIVAAGGSASSPGSEQFGVNIVRTSGANGVADSDYDGSTFYYNGAAAADSVATCAATCTEDVYSATYLANIATGTVSGSYSTALTYVATGTF